MNPEHLKEQQEAVEAASQQLEFREHQLRSAHWSGWLVSIALLTAIILPIWLYLTDHLQSRDAAYNTEIEGLKVSETRQQDQIGSLRNESARQVQSNERLADQQRAQAAQIATVRVDLSEQQVHQAQLEQAVRELILRRAEDEKQLEQLILENKALQEELAANDNAQAKQADLVHELQKKIEDKNQELPHKRGFLGIFHNK